MHRHMMRVAVCAATQQQLDIAAQTSSQSQSACSGALLSAFGWLLPSGQHGGDHRQALRPLPVCCHPRQGQHSVKQRHQVRPLQQTGGSALRAGLNGRMVGGGCIRCTANMQVPQMGGGAASNIKQTCNQPGVPPSTAGRLACCLQASTRLLSQTLSAIHDEVHLQHHHHLDVCTASGRAGRSSGKLRAGASGRGTAKGCLQPAVLLALG